MEISEKFRKETAAKKENGVQEDGYNAAFKGTETMDADMMATHSRHVGQKYSDFVKMTDV